MNRRAIGCIAVVLMANATFTATAATCLIEGNGAPHTTSRQRTATGDASRHHLAVEATTHESPADAPPSAPRNEKSIPTCCMTFSPCMSSLPLAAAVITQQPVALGVSTAALSEQFPASHLVAPDTPPPKS